MTREYIINFNIFIVKTKILFISIKSNDDIVASSGNNNDELSYFILSIATAGASRRAL